LNNLVKNIGIWLVIGLVVLTVVKQFDARQTSREGHACRRIVLRGHIAWTLAWKVVPSALSFVLSRRWKVASTRRVIVFSAAIMLIS
jgi:hypothetical protein